MLHLVRVCLSIAGILNSMVVDSEADSFPLAPPFSSLVRAYGKVLVLVPVFQFTHPTS